MRIEFECSGGYANLSLRYHADTDSLSKEIREELLSLVQNSGASAIKENDLIPELSVPDILTYRLVLHDGEIVKLLVFNDLNVPASLRPLISRLQELSLSNS